VVRAEVTVDELGPSSTLQERKLRGEGMWEVIRSEDCDRSKTDRPHVVGVYPGGAERGGRTGNG
jgi:hypothetical protein